MFTRANKQRIIDIIMNDAEIKGRYINKAGQTCVIGGMAIAAGIDLKRIYRTANNTRSISHPMNNDLADLLKKEFGLNYRALIMLQGCNDKFSKRKERQRNLVTIVNLMLTSG